MAWLWIRPGGSILGRNPWDSNGTSMSGWRLEDPCSLWYKKPNLCATPGAPGPGAGSPQALWYEQDPWTPEYRNYTDGWPPPDPDTEPDEYQAWIRTVLTYTWPRQYYPYSQWASCPPPNGFNQFPCRADMKPEAGRPGFMNAANALQNIWDNSSSQFNPIGPNGKPNPRYRILWLRPNTDDAAGWEEVLTISRVRIDSCIGQREHFTGSGISTWTSRFAFRFGYYEHDADYPSIPTVWDPLAITWSDTIQVGASIAFGVRPYFAELTLGAPTTKDNFEKRGYILVSYWPLDGQTQNTIDVHRTWFGVDANSGPVPPGTGPNTPVLSVIG